MSLDLTQPNNLTNYSDVLEALRQRDDAAYRMFDGVDVINIPIYTKRWNSSTKRLEQWNGSVWVEIADKYAINVDKLDGMDASADAAANTIIARDGFGRAKVTAPADADDIARKAEVDSVINSVSIHSNTTSGGIHGSTPAAMPNTLMHRDANGRAQVATPIDGNDIANLDTVISTSNTMIGTLKLAISRLFATTLWTQRTNPMDAINIRDISYGNGLFVAAGDAGQLATSPDGITWTQRTTPFGFTSIKGVTYGNGLYVAVGASGKIATSPDGITWTQRTNPFGSVDINAVVYGGFANRYVAVGSEGKMAFSTDGITWTDIPYIESDFSEYDNVFDVIYGDGTYIAFANMTGKWASSTDAETWQTFSFLGISTATCAAYGNGLFLIGGADGKLFISPDSYYWEEHTSSFDTTTIRCISYGNGLFVAVGDAGKLATSLDGVNWTQRTGSFGENIYSVTYGNGIYVAVGGQGKIVTTEYVV